MSPDRAHRRVLIVGAGPQAKVVIDIFRALGREVSGLLDDDTAKHGRTVLGARVLGSLAWGLETLGSDVEYFVAIGSNAARARVADRVRRLDRILASAIHPSAVLGSDVRCGSNVLVCAGSVVGVETQLEDDAVINTCASVDHESHVGRAAYLAPGVRTAGCIRVGNEAFVGVAAALGPGVTIGDGAIIGAGSLVLADVPSKMVAWGRPAVVVRAVSEPVDWAKLLGGESRA